jgi:hypothetical protein
MTPQGLVQFIWDYGNIPSAAFKAKYPELIARREVINDFEGNTRSATMCLIVELASEIIEPQEAPVSAQQAAGE